MSPKNENASALGRGASQNISAKIKPQNSSVFKPDPTDDDDEPRRNSALCFQNRDKTEDWHASYIGVLVPEDLPTGSKVWVNVREKLARNGKPFLIVSLRPWRSKPS